MSLLEVFAERAMVRHTAEVARGLHDADCEYGPTFLLCNCAMRARIASGVTTPPTDDLDFPPPMCTRCDRDLEHETDRGWVCHHCHLVWAFTGAGSSCKFTDDNGDLSWCEEHQRRACHLHPTAVPT